jgi:hypothetical protein
MVPLVSLITGLRRPESAALGDCLVCSATVRECDDRMRVHGRYVHTRCAGYRLRSIAESRALGSRAHDKAFTGD